MNRRLSSIAGLAAGFGGLVGGTIVGWSEGWLDAIISPPPIVRAALIATFVVAGFVLVGRAAGRIASAAGSAADLADAGRNLPAMIRGVRLAFLAVAAFAASAAWIATHPLPLVVALVIAAVDVLETSFLLLVVTKRHGDRDAD